MITYEIMRKFTYAGYKIRLWIADDPNFDNDSIVKNIIELVSRDFYYNYLNVTLKDMATRLISLSELINAIEILDSSDNGVVLYKDWP